MNETTDAPLRDLDNESIRKLSQRSLALATACLAVVVLVMVVSMFLVVGLAGSAEDDADAASVENAELRSELACRSRVAADFSILQGELDATIAQALVMLSRGEQLDGIEATLDELSAGVLAAAAARQESVDGCLIEND